MSRGYWVLVVVRSFGLDLYEALEGLGGMSFGDHDERSTWVWGLGFRV